MDKSPFLWRAFLLNHPHPSSGHLLPSKEKEQMRSIITKEVRYERKRKGNRLARKYYPTELF